MVSGVVLSPENLAKVNRLYKTCLIHFLVEIQRKAAYRHRVGQLRFLASSQRPFSEAVALGGVSVLMEVQGPLPAYK